jgi:hypothetical protein
MDYAASSRKPSPRRCPQTSDHLSEWPADDGDQPKQAEEWQAAQSFQRNHRGIIWRSGRLDQRRQALGYGSARRPILPASAGRWDHWAWVSLTWIGGGTVRRSTKCANKPVLRCPPPQTSNRRDVTVPAPSCSASRSCAANSGSFRSWARTVL